MKLVRIHQGKSLKLWLRILIVIISIILMIAAFKSLSEPWSIMLPIIISILPPASWFATNILEINASKGLIFKGAWAMGFRFGTWKRFEALEITYDHVPIKLTTYTLPNNRIITTDKEYQAFAEIDAEEKIYLFGHPLKERIDQKVQMLHKKLGLNT